MKALFSNLQVIVKKMLRSRKFKALIAAASVVALIFGPVMGRPDAIESNRRTQLIRWYELREQYKRKRKPTGNGDEFVIDPGRSGDDDDDKPPDPKWWGTIIFPTRPK
jgi:hypothetical protein